MNELAREAVKQLLGMLNRPLGTMRLRRALARAEPPYRVQIGSGRVRLDGWICTDIDWSARHYLDATRPWPFPPGSVGYVYADNVIEHLPLPATRRWLRHMLTAMAPGGVVRFATPDIERIARIYLDDPAMAAAAMARNARLYPVAHPVDILTNTFTEAGHHRGYLWDLAALTAELGQAGWVDVVRCESGHSSHEPLNGLEQRDTPVEAAQQLIVEASAPAVPR